MIYIKTVREIELIRKSSEIVAETLDLVKNSAKVGISTIELDKIAENYINSKGAKPAFKGYKQVGTPPFPGTLCISINEEVVHGIPSSRVLKNGDIVSIDVGVIKDGYFVDAALTFFVGEISQEYLRLLRITEESLYVGIAKAIENNRIGDISSSIQNYIEENGFSIVRELTGHGVGKYLHEEPSIPNFGRKNQGPKLKKGMTIAIEPMVNYGKKEVLVRKDGWTVFAKDCLPSAHFEHTILVTDKEPEILTKI